ncbi:MAG: archease, partial [Thermodesulfobacteriota bacterium]
MGFSYLEHVSDVGFLAYGESIEEAFKSGAEALLNIVFDLDTIGDDITVPITAHAPAPELLFVESLNELISILDSEGLALKGIREVRISKERDGYSFNATSYGEKFNADIHTVKCEVKGATYSGLTYEVKEGTHRF